MVHELEKDQTIKSMRIEIESYKDKYEEIKTESKILKKSLTEREMKGKIRESVEDIMQE